MLFACWDSYSTTSAAWFCLRVWIVQFICMNYCNRFQSKLLTVLTQKGNPSNLGFYNFNGWIIKIIFQLHHLQYLDIPDSGSDAGVCAIALGEHFEPNPRGDLWFSQHLIAVILKRQTRFSRSVNDMNIYECCSEGHQFLRWKGINIYIYIYYRCIYIISTFLLCPAGFIHITASTRRCKNHCFKRLQEVSTIRNVMHEIEADLAMACQTTIVGPGSVVLFNWYITAFQNLVACWKFSWF